MPDRLQRFERPRKYADEPELPYWPSFIEKLLLAIIDANSSDATSGMERAANGERQKRLNIALDALFGSVENRGNKHIYLLHAAVAAADSEIAVSGAVAFEHWRFPDMPRQDRTKTKSKRSAIAEFNALTQGQSKVSRAKRVERFERRHREYLANVAMLREHPEELEMLRDLREVAHILEKWGFAALLEVEALGMASLWERNRPQLRPKI